VWHPELAALNKRYPQTQEKYDIKANNMRALVKKQQEAGFVPSRAGIPDGWSGQRKEVNALRAKAAAEAKEIMKTMADEGLLKTGEDPRAEEALEFAITVVRAVNEEDKAAWGIRERISAAKLVLEYTKSKPSTKVEATVNKAEDFLALLAAK
jgi:hypothetical protein